MHSSLLIEPTVTSLLQQADCTLFYRVNHIHACSHDGREYHICCLSDVAHMTQGEFQQALQIALSFHLSSRQSY